jgi:hypothetical protein
VPATSQLPRLTNIQYDNTIRDLVGLDTQPSSMLAPDSLGSVDQRTWDGYKAAAAALAPQVISNAAAKAKVVTCTPAMGDGGAACAQQVIKSFGQRAFRRPLTADETTRFTKLFTDRATLTATGSFDEAMQLIVEGFLVSPSFIYRTETSTATSGTTYVLNGWEVASRLSYMLWGSMPDEALFTKASSDSLKTPQAILEEATRMLADPRARARVSAFHETYALMGQPSRWSEATHDVKAFPKFSAALVPLFSAETKKFFDFMTFDQKATFQDLLTKPIAFVNNALAPIYGMDSSKYGADLVKADLDPAQRAGVFTHAGFLASFSSFDRTSPILRGAFLQKQILCTQIPSPPEGAATTPLPATGATNRERVDAQTAGDACKGCHHNIVNPTGFALEAYDAIGGWQTTERGTGAAINSAANVPIGGAAVAVTGPVDLMTKIAASAQAQACYAQHWVQFAYERDLTPQDSCTVQGLATKMTPGGYTVLNLVSDLTQTDSFRYRVKAAP